MAPFFIQALINEYSLGLRYELSLKFFDDLDKVECQMFFALLWQGFRIIGVNKGDFVFWRIETDVIAGDIVRNDKVTSLF